MERLKYPVNDGMIHLVTRKDEEIEIFPENIIWFQRGQEKSSGRLDIRDLSQFDLKYLNFLDDDLTPFRAYIVKETSIHNPRLRRYLRTEASK